MIALSLPELSLGHRKCQRSAANHAPRMVQVQRSRRPACHASCARSRRNVHLFGWPTAPALQGSRQAEGGSTRPESFELRLHEATR
jgi:hypothetical protein